MPILGTKTSMPNTSGLYAGPTIQWFPAAKQYVMITWYYPTLSEGTGNYSVQQTGVTMWQIWTAKSRPRG
jgi:hypothetical protein